MSSPFLDLALGALRGSQANRKERRELEDRSRRQRLEDTALRLQLAELADNPNFEVSDTPFLDAATAGGAPAAPTPTAPPPVAGPGIPQPGPRGPTLDDEPALGAGVPDASVSRPAAGARTGGSSTPHLDAGLDLGAVDVGGQQYHIRARPGNKRARAEQNNRAAYEALHEADPEAYPTFIENMPEGYYSKELSDYASGVRAGRIEDKRARREGRAQAARDAAERRRDAARDEAFRLFQEGKSFEDVVSALSGDHELRGVLTRSEIRREQQNAGAINAPDREKAARMSTLRTQLGKPPQPTAGAEPIDAELQRDVIEALADGHTSDEILEALGNSAAAGTVRRWLRRGRQLAQPPAP